jgi:hypothetical protein
MPLRLWQDVLRGSVPVDQGKYSLAFRSHEKVDQTDRNTIRPSITCTGISRKDTLDSISRLENLRHQSRKKRTRTYLCDIAPRHKVSTPDDVFRSSPVRSRHAVTYSREHASLGLLNRLALLERIVAIGAIFLGMISHSIWLRATSRPDPRSSQTNFEAAIPNVQIAPLDLIV